VKPHVMERLGRLLEGEVLPTLDILLPSGSNSATSSAPASPGATPLNGSNGAGIL
jgi:hypothetical protein